MEEEILTQLIMQPGTPAEKIFSLRFFFFCFSPTEEIDALTFVIVGIR